MADLEQQDLFDNEPDEDHDLVKVSCDGSTYPTNPGAGGIGLVFRFKKGSTLHIKTVSRGIPRWVELKGDNLRLAKMNKTKSPQDKGGKFYMETTNNRAEILAVIEALKRVKKPERTYMVLYCDSQWAINMSNGTWKAKENKELVAIAQAMVAKFLVVEFKWVRGHAGDRFNEWCDTLAYDAAKNQPPEPVVTYVKE